MSAPLATRPVSNPPAVRVLPVPRSEPPSDEELVAAGLDGAAVVAAPLPLDLPPYERPPRRAAADAGVRGQDQEPGQSRASGKRQDRRPGPSPARLAVRRFLATCLEVLGGFRPVTHLRPLCRPDRYAGIAERVTPTGTLARPVGAGRTGPPRTGRSSQTGPGDRVAVRRVQVCEVLDDVAEAAVVLARRERVWAMALRLECVRGRWLCSHLEVL